MIQGIDVPSIVRLRRDMATRLGRNDAARVRAAEDALAAAVRRVTPAGREALLLLASMGLEQGLLYAQAFLAVAGDVPARALHTMRQAERRESSAQQLAAARRALELDPNLPAPILLRACLEEVSGQGTEALGVLLERAPEEVFMAMQLLQSRGVSRVLNDILPRALARTSSPKERARLLLVRALANRSIAVYFDPDNPKLSEDMTKVSEHHRLSRSILLDTSEALLLRPGLVSGHLLRATAISSLGRGAYHEVRPDERVLPDLYYDLACARAGAPYSGAITLAELGLQDEKELFRLVQEQLAKGFIDNATSVYCHDAGRRHLLRKAVLPLSMPLRNYDFSQQADVAEAIGKMDEAPLLRLSLCVLLGLQPDEGALGALEGLKRFDPPRASCLEAVIRFGRTKSSSLPPDEATTEEGFRALLLATPAGLHGRLTDLQVRGASVRPRFRYLPDGVRAVSALTAPSSPRIMTAWLNLHRPEMPWGIWAARVRDLRQEPPGRALEGLRDPASNATFFVRSAQDPFAQAAMANWLLLRREYGEGLLAYERSLAFSWADPNLFHFQAVTTLRHGAFALKGATQANVRLMALGVASRSASVCPAPALFHCLVIDLALDLAGETRDARERAKWLQVVRERIQGASQGVPSAIEAPEVTLWRMVRIRVALGEPEAAVEALEQVKALPRQHELRMNPKDPWAPALRAVPAVRAFMDQARR